VSEWPKIIHALDLVNTLN